MTKDEFVIDHTDTDRKVTLASPGIDRLETQSADGTLCDGRRCVATVTPG